MNWRESSGRESCNRCRQTIDLGRPLYVGQLTRAYWCERCAGEVLGMTLSDSVEVPKVRPVADSYSRFSREEMAAKLKAAILARRKPVVTL